MCVCVCVCLCLCVMSGVAFFLCIVGSGEGKKKTHFFCFDFFDGKEIEGTNGKGVS